MDKTSILVVDDDASNIYLLKLILKKEGYHTITASNGIEAVGIIETTDIDLILMDVMMPQMDGFEASGRIHKMEKHAHIPIILLTAKRRELHDVLRGLEEGALEYMSKPFEQSELLAKVKSMLRIKRLHDINLKLVKELQKKQTQMDLELQIAKRVQTAMLPSTERLGFNDKCIIDTHYSAKESIGGDFFDFIEYGQNRLAILLADVSGHGPAAAMITAIIKTLIINESADLPQPSEFMKRLNEKLLAMIPEDHFVTFFFSVIDFNKNTITYTNCGHPPPFLLGEKRDGILEFEKNGTMVGMFDDAFLGQDTMKIEKGDKLFIYSDGIYEIFNNDGDLYGLHRVKGYLELNKGNPCREIIDGIISEVDNYWDGKSERDDIAVVAVEFL